MNDRKPDWYNRLNLNEKRIIDVFVETQARHFVSRPCLEMKLCRTKLMNQRTLTARLEYLMDEGILGKVVGEKGAVFYAAKPLIDAVLIQPWAKLLVDCAIDACSPKEISSVPMPVRLKMERISDSEMWGNLVRAGETWEKVGRGSPRQKEKVYRDLQKRRKELVRKAGSTREDGV